MGSIAAVFAWKNYRSDIQRWERRNSSVASVIYSRLIFISTIVALIIKLYLTCPYQTAMVSPTPTPSRLICSKSAVVAPAENLMATVQLSSTAQVAVVFE